MFCAFFQTLLSDTALSWFGTNIYTNILFFLPFQEVVETTTVVEITTVAEIIEEVDSDGDDSVRL